MPAQPTPSPRTAPETAVTEIGPRVYGVFDLIRPDRMGGWAIDRGNSAAAVDVDVHREGRLIATIRADRHRPDLHKGGVGTGNYGFVVELSPPIEPGFEFTLAATARTPDGAQGTLKRGGKSPAASPEHRVTERLFEEVLSIGQVQAAQTQAIKSAADAADRLVELVARAELMQIRLESALAAVEPPAQRVRDGGLRIILWVTLAIALGSLGLGLYSMFLA